jgi:hypothetical protein
MPREGGFGETLGDIAEPLILLLSPIGISNAGCSRWPVR